ncbi:glycoside hydrolase family 2 TIM barrel-domain containing protein [uncultured Bacteroides sp.]|uniref:glycoside hydrolase family 2 TIM barrel-domain containing protein n=1 Tax=uncultured Bacteroides sp. TaxID=162156 RepID=UPI002AA84C45|nr:glycoside hydrolase family 2 TIM barrel-domain containing protein [uncultured Bacteroides sp.]
MNSKQITSIFLMLFLFFQLSYSQVRQVSLLDRGWKFHKGESSLAFQKDFDDSNWKNVTIPHDWAIGQPFFKTGDGSTGKLDWRGEGWYRRKIDLPKESRGKRVYLLFDGIMAFPTVYINGKLAGGWDYGYNSFFLDVTDYLNFGENNSLAIHADTRRHDSRWYPGAGIYRKIQMIVVNSVHVNIWGTYVTTPVIKPNYADVRVSTTLTNNSGTDQNIVVRNTILSKNKIKLQEREQTVAVPANQNRMTDLTIPMTNPTRWDLENPYLYILITKVYHAGELIDSCSTDFGVRDIRLTSDRGLFLNDKRVLIKGVNLHHDLGPLGAAFNVRAMEHRLEIMKNMGCNAIRTSHNVSAPELLDLCDRMGFLVLDEAFDKYDAKIDMTDTTDFEGFAERNIRNFITRDRNHPSVFLWSVGNEMREMEMNENNGFHRLHTMVNYARKYDVTRPVTMATDMYESTPLRSFDYYDVHSWNYGRRYSWAHLLEPNKPVIITESASTVSTRGFYEFPLPDKKTAFTKSLQVSSYDLNAPEWAEVPDDDFMWQQEDPFVAGEFVWTGFDYLGEPIPYGAVKELGLPNAEASRSSYFGIVDLCGIPKDRYYLYKSYWKPDETTVHILPHWNWSDRIGKNVPVFVYTNGDCAELFLNGKSLGKKYKDPRSDKSIERFRLMWNDVMYEPGELKVIAYKEGVKIGESIVRTADKPFRLRLTPDRTVIKADGSDLSYVLVEAIDKDGNICPLVNNKIEVKISGTGKLAGVGNGNPQSFNFFGSNKVDLFYGKAMIIVKSGDTKGNITVATKSEGLKPTSAAIKVD